MYIIIKQYSNYIYILVNCDNRGVKSCASALY